MEAELIAGKDARMAKERPPVAPACWRASAGHPSEELEIVAYLGHLHQNGVQQMEKTTLIVVPSPNTDHTFETI